MLRTWARDKFNAIKDIQGAIDLFNQAVAGFPENIKYHFSRVCTIFVYYTIDINHLNDLGITTSTYNRWCQHFRHDAHYVSLPSLNHMKRIISYFQSEIQY